MTDKYEDEENGDKHLIRSEFQVRLIGGDQNDPSVARRLVIGTDTLSTVTDMMLATMITVDRLIDENGYIEMVGKNADKLDEELDKLLSDTYLSPEAQSKRAQVADDELRNGPEGKDLSEPEIMAMTEAGKFATLAQRQLAKFLLMMYSGNNLVMSDDYIADRVQFEALKWLMNEMGTDVEAFTDQGRVE